MPPETKYARANDGVHIAYQVAGEGPLDVVQVPGFVSHVELMPEVPFFERTMRHVTAYARLIRFDKRGTGLSDRETGIPTLEQRMDDVRSVMDAVGSERAALWGTSEGGPMCVLFAATYPERTAALVLRGSFARVSQGQDQSFGYPPDAIDEFSAAFAAQWGTGTAFAAFFPSLAGDERMTEVFARIERNSASPGAMARILTMAAEIDVRNVLPTISCPTIVIHSAGDAMIPVEHGRYLAEHIPDARYVELQSADHIDPSAHDVDVLEEIEEFLTGHRSEPDPERVLATVLFTDIVGSTEQAAALGDARWKATLDRHDEVMRQEIQRFRGQAIKATGDGFLAAFDGPARATQCALEVTRSLGPLGIEIRAGVHTGECEQRGEDLGGIAVHIGARIAALARPGEVLVSRTVTDLVAGSGLRFVDRGEHALRGVPDRWHLFAAAS